MIQEKGGEDGLLFDPFAGSGTSLLAAQGLGLASAGAERHPFIARVALAKLNWNVEDEELKVRSAALLASAKMLKKSGEQPNGLLEKCYSPDAWTRLDALKAAYFLGFSSDSAVDELLWLAITSILRECSGVGTAQWQYVLPNKVKARVTDPYVAFQAKVESFRHDIRVQRDRSYTMAGARLANDDARSLSAFPELSGRVSLVITSPPYPNNYDYADATRLEMTFWGEINSWSDLQDSVRTNLVRSCSQHSAAEKLQLDELLGDEVIEPIRSELKVVCEELSRVRLDKGGRKTYHTMVAAYFVDLARVWLALRPLCRNEADVCFVIGDSAPYGVYVPVDRWLSALAEAANFHSPKFEKLRDRNLKWKNRKHRVPLQEGNLWLKA